MGNREFVTSTDYEHPHRPFPIRVFNALGRSSGKPGPSGRLEVGGLVEQARRKTGLANFGDDGHVEALHVLVESINDEARLTATGRLIQKSRLAGALVHRLRIEELLRAHPEIHDIDLGRIILITGLQRTGTTLLHRLFNSNPAIRSVSGAEMLEPVPAGTTKRRGTIARTLRPMLTQRAIAYLSPHFMAVHPIRPGEPEEDVMLLDLNFMSQAPEAMMHVPGYSRWLEDQDHTQAYEYFRKVLKVLCWQRPGRRWVLKTPHHMEYMDVFLKTFPDATVVQTHRDPRKALPSFCSMVAHGRGIFSDHVDPKEIARHWCRKTRRMVELTEAVRSRADPDRFIDVSYYDLIEDPIAQLRRLYRRIGIDLDEAAVQRAERYIEVNPQDRFGRHSYRLSDFELSEVIIDNDFAGYREKHAIPFE